MPEDDNTRVKCFIQLPDDFSIDTKSLIDLLETRVT